MGCKRRHTNSYTHKLGDPVASGKGTAKPGRFPPSPAVA